MIKSVADIKKKFTSAYFGWIKFETKSELMPMIKKAVDANPHILRYLLIKTVRENTLYVPKLNVRAVSKDETVSKPKKSIKTEEVKISSKKDLEDIDKSIDELVAE